MPLKGKKGTGGKRKGKQNSKKTTKPTSTHVKEECADIRSSFLRPGETLVGILRSHPVDRKEIFGLKVTTHVLEQLTPQEIRDLRAVFELFDCNSDGFLGSKDLSQVLRTLGFKISRDEAAKLIQDVNVEGRRKINFCEFLEVVIDRQGDASDPYGEIIKGFEMFDIDKTGSVSVEKLRQVGKQAGIKLTQKELEGMIEEADVNGDGRVDESEFVRIMLRTNLF